MDDVKQIATFENPETKVLTTKPYDFLHITPPQGPPKFIADSEGLANGAGYVDVDKATC